MRRRSGSVALLCGLSLIAPGCAADKGSAIQGEIPIGVSIERSGPGRVLGEAHENALKLVVEDINKEGVLGKKIKLIIKDNKSSEAESLQRVKSLIDNDKVVALIGGGTSPTTLAVVDTVEERKVPMVSMGSSDEIVSPIAKRQYIFKTPCNPQPIVDVMLREFATNRINKVGLLAVNNAYGASGVKAVKNGVERSGVSLVGTELFEAADKDYSVQVAKLIAKKPQAIVVWSIMPGAGYAAKNIEDLGFRGKVYFDAGAGAEFFVKSAGTASDGMLMVHPSILAANQLTATTPSALAQKEFFIKYTQKYGTFSGFASYSADALRLIVEAIKKANSTDRHKVRDALESLSYDGLTGSYAFGPNNHGGVSGDALTVLEVRAGGWVLAQ
jgi:branched-chain amino acid transport system substrate-binding protein